MTGEPPLIVSPKARAGGARAWMAQQPGRCAGAAVAENSDGGAVSSHAVPIIGEVLEDGRGFALKNEPWCAARFRLGRRETQERWREKKETGKKRRTLTAMARRRGLAAIGVLETGVCPVRSTSRHLLLIVEQLSSSHTRCAAPKRPLIAPHKRLVHQQEAERAGQT